MSGKSQTHLSAFDRGRKAQPGIMNPFAEASMDHANFERGRRFGLETAEQDAAYWLGRPETNQPDIDEGDDRAPERLKRDIMVTERRSKRNSIEDAAEAVFKPVQAKAEAPARPAAIPGAREMVSLRIDQDVLAHFQEDGPGWQDRLNAALRKAAGLA